MAHPALHSSPPPHAERQGQPPHPFP
jgi:hypothetical protein